MAMKWLGSGCVMVAAVCTGAALAHAVTGGTVLAKPGSSRLTPANTRGFGVLTDDRYAVLLRQGPGLIPIRNTKTGRR
jgi:hypothetical protein